ncbi:MAG: hypothetical protein L6R40_005248 [Gallowayella cf. fulva]|nr:MAG: hypothetical protein L6R40_005248 [Xanthomendoza cf. fulva]
MARPFDAHVSSNISPTFFSTSVAANRAWDTPGDATSYPASIKYDDAAQTFTNTGTSVNSTRNQKGLRLAKIKSSPSHGALAAARSASRQGRIHRRGRSASETTTPITPTFTSPLAPPHSRADMTAPPALPPSSYAMPPPATTSKTKVKIRPLLRKLSSHDQNTIDLSRSAAENEGLGIYTSSDIGDSRKASLETGYLGRGYHNRTTSTTSHVSATTTSSHHKHSAQYIHPMRQTPRPYTPPLAGSFANSLDSGSSTGALPTVPHELIHADQATQHFNTNSTPYPPLPSPRRIYPPPLHLRTGSAPRLTSASQTNLPGTPSSLRKHTTESNNAEVPTMPASTRTSFESMFRFRSRANTNEDPVVRAAQVAILRKEFDEKERAKDQLRQEQEAKKAQREAKRQVKRDESEQRESESRARKRAQSNTMSEKSAIRAFDRQHDQIGARQDQGGNTIAGSKGVQAKGRGATPGVAGKAMASRWQLFVFWLKTMWLKTKKSMGVGNS